MKRILALIVVGTLLSGCAVEPYVAAGYQSEADFNFAKAKKLNAKQLELFKRYKITSADEYDAAMLEMKNVGYQRNFTLARDYTGTKGAVPLDRNGNPFKFGPAPYGDDSFAFPLFLQDKENAQRQGKSVIQLRNERLAKEKAEALP